MNKPVFVLQFVELPSQAPKPARGRPRDDGRRIAVRLGFSLLAHYYGMPLTKARKELAKDLAYGGAEGGEREVRRVANANQTKQAMGWGMEVIGEAREPGKDMKKVGIACWFGPDCCVEETDSEISVSGSIWFWRRGMRAAQKVGKVSMTPVSEMGRAQWLAALFSWQERVRKRTL